MSESVPRELLVLFADISGSTSIYEQLGDAAAVELIQGLLGRMEEEVYFHRGVVIKSIGDELLCTFPDVVSGLAAATAMQQQAAAVAGPGGRALALRVGMHFGPALEERGDVFGDAVNVAARVVELARPGQVLITDACFEKVPLLGRSRIRAIDRMTIRGRSTETTILEAMWQRGRAITTVVPPVLRSHDDEGSVVLQHGERAFTIHQQSAAFLIGRDAQCQLVVASTMASRQHASIQWRRGKFVLSDRSTNGTFIVPDGGRAIHLRREEFVLQGAGSIGLGEQPRADSAGALRYEFKPAAGRN
jgi:class 3 adenylate cyclase